VAAIKFSCFISRRTTFSEREMHIRRNDACILR
jgi:hypothetical protein